MISFLFTCFVNLKLITLVDGFSVTDTNCGKRSLFLPKPLLFSSINLRPNSHPRSSHPRSQSSSRKRTTHILFMSKDGMPDFNSDDPFQLLGMTDPTADKDDIKRAYRRMAMKCHPDVITTKDTTEKGKKQASDNFAKINWAYEVLSGKNKDGSRKTESSSSSSSSSSSDSGGAGWTPPHRRKGGTSTSSGFDDWKNYAPKYDESDYDTGGDSFSQIFSDAFSGAAAGYGSANGGGSSGVFRDLIDFLENNVGGSGAMGNGDDDMQLTMLLNTGTVDDIGNEMDDTELVVQSLSKKLINIQDELMDLQQDIKINLDITYRERIEMQTRIEELEAKQRVTNTYRKKSQDRLVKLQTKYKDLIVSGRNDNYAGGDRKSTSSSRATSNSYDDGNAYGRATSSRGTTRNNSNTGSSAGSSYSTSSTSASGGSDNKSDESWKTEGFGSSGRSRGSSRRGSASRRKRQQQQQQEGGQNREKTAARSSSYSTRTNNRNDDDSRQEQQRSSSNYGTRDTNYDVSTSSSSSSSSSYVPPHRRTSNADPFKRLEEEDKRRLRELKIDDEFDRLKKDLGL